MAKKISQFTEATTIKSGDISVVVQDGETKQFPLDLLVTKAQADEYKTGVETQLADYEQEITNIKNQYNKELYTPTITVTNTSMVKTGQGDTVDYSASVEDGVVKSAILKGQTLVNLNNSEKSKTSYSNTCDFTMSYLKPNTTYTIIFEVSYSGTESNGTLGFLTTDKTGWNVNTSYDGNGSYKKLLTTKSNIDLGVTLRFRRNIVDGGFTISNVVVLEGDYTNKNIHHFTGMQSVKMPVLTTTGKNLFNKTDDLIRGKFINGIDGSDGLNQDYFVSNFIPISNNTSYKVSGNTFGYVGGSVGMAVYDINKNFVSASNSTIISTGNNSYYIRVSVHLNDLETFQLEQGSTATSYEPYKSNILSTPEDLELRGIGDVKDTLDLMTGEVSQNLIEFEFNNEDYFYNEPIEYENTLRWQIAGNIGQQLKLKTYGKICSPNFINDNTNGDFEHIRTDGSIPYANVFLYLSKTKASTYEELKTYIKNNPFTIIAEKAEKSIKTVVLNPSGTLASETPYMWKNGSIQVSSDGLIPCLDYAVTTSRVGVIEDNMSETITNEKRIHALEVMLAQSTITSATDAVSLQSDLETTTMTVDGAQLDTGNTQDDFLYEMILLLIENNAYNESLFDKVCAFYLYGKLSDEQFTNIYNLLYPVNSEEE